MSFPEQTPDRDKLLKKWQRILDSADHVKSWTDGHELAWLCEVASRSNSICEIGSYHGKSALCMALASPTAKMLCVDNCENKEVEHEFTKNLMLAHDPVPRIRFMQGTSEKLRGMVVSFDMGFIDAGHLKQDVMTDIANLRPLMRDNSVLCGHDWNKDMNDGVNQAVIESFGQPDGVFESLWFVKL